MELKDALIQYSELKEEIKDCKKRVADSERLLRRIEEEGVVSDTVMGTRKDGTIGPIRITGYPVPAYESAKNMLRKRVEKLHIKEDELFEALNQVETYIDAIPRSDLRQIFQLYYIDDCTWSKVAMIMNSRFPKRRIKYTEDSCRMRHNRYLEKNELF